MFIRTGDLVQVIAGKSKGSIGRVTRVDRQNDRVVVAGVNLVTRNQRPNQIQEGGRIRKEAPIHVSNVLLYSEDDQRSYRVGVRFEGQDDQLFATKQEAAVTFTEAPSRINKVRVFLKKGGELTRVPEAQKGDEA